MCWPEDVLEDVDLKQDVTVRLKVLNQLWVYYTTDGAATSAKMGPMI